MGHRARAPRRPARTTPRRGAGRALLLVLGLLLDPLPAAELPDTVARLKPSIVGIGTSQRTRRPPHRFTGTGFAVADGGRVLTNLHVLPREIAADAGEFLAVFLSADRGGAVRRATLAAQDERHDLALLEIEGAPLPALVLGDDSRVREGQRYAFTGFPIGPVLGLYPVTHEALVAAIAPIVIPADASRQLTPALIRTLRAPYRVFQLDAVAYPGNSGSPLYDPASGAVVGIINQVLVKGSREFMLERPSGIAYAVPIRFARALLARVAP